MFVFMLINVKMPTIVGILTFMSRINFMLSRVEHENSFITLGPGLMSILGPNCLQRLSTYDKSHRQQGKSSKKDLDFSIHICFEKGNTHFYSQINTTH